MACRPAIVPASGPHPGCGRVADAHSAGAAGDPAPARLGVPTPGSGATVPGFPKGRPVAAEPVGPSDSRRDSRRPAGFGPGPLPPSRPPGTRERHPRPPAPDSPRRPSEAGTRERHPRPPARDSPRRPSGPKSGTSSLPGDTRRHRRRRPGAAGAVPRRPGGSSSPTRANPARRPGAPPLRDGPPPPTPTPDTPRESPARSGVRAPRPAEEASPSADLALDEEFPAVAPRSGARRGNGVAAAVVVAVRIPEAGPSRSGLRPRGEARSEPSAPLRGTRFHALPGLSPARRPPLPGPSPQAPAALFPAALRGPGGTAADSRAPPSPGTGAAAVTVGRERGAALPDRRKGLRPQRTSHSMKLFPPLARGLLPAGKVSLPARRPSPSASQVQVRDTSMS